MKILLLTIGSAGDVHPFIGLGLALKARGHDVKIITNPFFGEIANRVGLELIPLGTAELFREALGNPLLWHRRKGPVAVFEIVLSGLRETYDAVANNYVPGETVVVTSSLGFGARIAQDKLGIPTATVHLSPAEFRSLTAPAKLTGLWMPPGMPMWLRKTQWWVADSLFIDRLAAPKINAFRAELGLPPVKGILRDFWNSPRMVLGLFPEWYAAPQADWPPQARLTGFPRYDESDAHQRNPDLDRFLAAGEPPIVFTPGSAMYHGQQFFLASVEACKRLNRRGILLTRHAGQIPANLPDTVKHFVYAPFSQLLPSAAALVHHGGIGTSAQAMAAACRQLITPFAHDQFDNADRLRRLGVGRTIHATQYTATAATRELGLLLKDESVARACRDIAGRLKNDQSVGKTCELIESLARVDSPV
jgi:UDP:flavonoid glycosyltransferase YjiC (YdhE family)